MKFRYLVLQKNCPLWHEFSHICWWLGAWLQQQFMICPLDRVEFSPIQLRYQILWAIFIYALCFLLCLYMSWPKPIYLLCLLISLFIRLNNVISGNDHYDKIKWLCLEQTFSPSPFPLNFCFFSNFFLLSYWLLLYPTLDDVFNWMIVNNFYHFIR